MSLRNRLLGFIYVLLLTSLRAKPASWLVSHEVITRKLLKSSKTTTCVHTGTMETNVNNIKIMVN